MPFPRHILVFVALGGAYTVFDCLEHILRPQGDFRDHALAWAAFSATAWMVMSGIMLGVLFLGMRANRRGLPIEITAIAVSMLAHTYLTGPLLIRLLYPYGFFQWYFPWLQILLSTALLLFLRWLLPPQKTNVPTP